MPQFMTEINFIHVRSKDDGCVIVARRIRSRSQCVTLTFSGRRFQVLVEQPVKQVFSSFAADAEPAGGAGARLESALDGSADGSIFLLDRFRNTDARFVTSTSVGRNIGEIEIENDFGSIDAERQDKICIHDSLSSRDTDSAIYLFVRRLRSIQPQRGGGKR
jgi:hypothetical protein